MPIHNVDGGVQWGGHGKVYRGKGARRKALAQARAAFANGYRGKSSSNHSMEDDMDQVKVASEQEIQAFVKGAMDYFESRQVPEEVGMRLLDQALCKQAAGMGLVAKPEPRRELIDNFKKDAQAVVKANK